MSAARSRSWRSAYARDEQLERGRARQPAVLRQLPQQPLGELDGFARVAAVEREPRLAQLGARRPLRPRAQLRRLLRAALAPAQLRQARQRAAEHPRPGPHEVLDRGLEHRLGVGPAAAPEMDGAVLGAAVPEHHAAAVAVGELRDPVAPRRRALEVEHHGAGRDQEAERPGSRDRVCGAALERGGCRLVEPAHAVVHARTRDEHGALEGEPEHLEVGDAAAAAELGRLQRELGGPGGVALRVRDVARVEGEPAVLRARLEVGQKPLGALQPAARHCERAAEVELVDRQPQGHPRRALGVAGRAVEREGALARREHRVTVIEPPGSPAEPLVRGRRVLRGERPLERRARLAPAGLLERCPAVLDDGRHERIVRPYAA